MKLSEAKRKLISGVKKRKNGCWEWQKGRFQYGYGAIVIGKKTMGTHRVSWMVFRGKIPKGVCVCHACDNPPCCNPSHLFLGSTSDNTKDAAAKGRTASGERNGNCKLSDAQVLEIRNRYKGQYGQMTSLAKEYEVSVDQIRNIIRGKRVMLRGSSNTELVHYDQYANRPPRSTEVKERIRAALKGRKRPKEVIDKIRASRWGKVK